MIRKWISVKSFMDLLTQGDGKKSDRVQLVDTFICIDIRHTSLTRLVE